MWQSKVLISLILTLAVLALWNPAQKPDVPNPVLKNPYRTEAAVQSPAAAQSAIPPDRLPAEAFDKPAAADLGRSVQSGYGSGSNYVILSDKSDPIFLTSSIAALDSLEVTLVVAYCVNCKVGDYVAIDREFAQVHWITSITNKDRTIWYLLLQRGGGGTKAVAHKAGSAVFVAPLCRFLLSPAAGMAECANR